MYILVIPEPVIAIPNYFKTQESMYIQNMKVQKHTKENIFGQAITGRIKYLLAFQLEDSSEIHCLENSITLGDTSQMM